MKYEKKESAHATAHKKEDKDPSKTEPVQNDKKNLDKNIHQFKKNKMDPKK
jgi:hypothetical protein